MKNLKRKIISFICTLIMMISFGSIVLADVNPLVDAANLLSVAEKESIVSSIEEFKKSYDMDLAIVTSNDLKGKSPEEFADEFYENNGYGVGSDHTGLILLIDMDGRNIWISTEGKALNYFTDVRIDSIIDDISKYLKNEEYSAACTVFVTDVKYYIDAGIPENEVNEESHTRNVLIVAFIAAALCSTITCVIINSSYKKPKKTSSLNYVDNKSIVFNKKKDTFINTYTTRTKIEKNNNSGNSGTTTHTSSSGRTHGGGGGKF